MTLTPLSTLLAARHRSGDALRFEIPDDWLQGRTSFGGLVSVLAVQAMRDVAAASWPPEVALRALQTNFIAPVEGGPVDVEVQVLREGRSVRQVQARLMQRGEVAALAVGVFGSPRDSRLPTFAPQRPAPVRPAEDIAAAPFVAGTRPNFVAHFDMRWSGGTPPFRGAAGVRDASIHLRLLDDDARALPPELMAVMMADCSPTPVLSQFDRPTPASSVSWALELRPLPAGEPVDGWWRADNLALAAADGYVNQQSMLWSPSGALAALAYQVVAIYG
jgi:acyl-CoA thioesterase